MVCFLGEFPVKMNGGSVSPCLLSPLQRDRKHEMIHVMNPLLRLPHLWWVWIMP